MPPVRPEAGRCRSSPGSSSLDDLEGITGRLGFVHEDHGRRPFLRRDLVFISPAAVIRHRPAFKKGWIELGRVLGIGYGRVIDQHDQGLVANVHPLVVVPAVLGGDHAVAHEDDLRVHDLDLLCHPPGNRHEIVGKTQPDRVATGLKRTHDPLGLETNQRNRLEKRAVRVSRLQPHFLELVGQIGNSLFLARCSRTSAFKFIRGQDLDVVQDLRRLDTLQRGLQIKRGRGSLDQSNQEGNPSDSSNVT